MKSLDAFVKDWNPDKNFLDAIMDHWANHHVKQVPGLIFYPNELTRTMNWKIPRQGVKIPTSTAIQLIKNKEPFFSKTIYEHLVDVYYKDYKNGKL